MMRLCLVCGAEFWATTSRSPTCSYDCHSKTRPPAQDLRMLWRKASVRRWARAKAAREAERLQRELKL
jgi:hypothetical protein